MAGQLIRGFVLIIFICFLISDLMELASYFPSAVPSQLFASPFSKVSIKNKFSRSPSASKSSSSYSSNKQSKLITKNKSSDEEAEEREIEKLTAMLNEKLNLNEIDSSRSRPNNMDLNSNTVARIEVSSKSKLSDEEIEQIVLLKAHWMSLMQKYCLPKLVCELHASLTDATSLTDAEKGLLSMIKDTSLGSSAEIISKYHFAAHMGQLLSGVEGNGCHNFYPNCPISGTRVLQMAKSVRIRT